MTRIHCFDFWPPVATLFTNCKSCLLWTSRSWNFDQTLLRTLVPRGWGILRRKFCIWALMNKHDQQQIVIGPRLFACHCGCAAGMRVIAVLAHDICRQETLGRSSELASDVPDSDIFWEFKVRWHGFSSVHHVARLALKYCMNCSLFRGLHRAMQHRLQTMTLLQPPFPDYL